MTIKTAEKLINLYKRAFRAALELGFFGKKKTASWWDELETGTKTAIDWREMQKQMTPEQLQQMMEDPLQPKQKQQPQRRVRSQPEVELSAEDVMGSEDLDLALDIDMSEFADTNQYQGMSAMELNDELQNAQMLLADAKRTNDQASMQKLERAVQTIQEEMDNLLRKGGMMVCGASWAALEQLAQIQIAERLELSSCGCR